MMKYSLFFKKYVLPGALILFLIGCGEPANTNINKEENVVQETVELKKEMANDFSKGTIDYQLGDFIVKVPSLWKESDPYFYAVTGEGNDFAMLYLTVDSTTVKESEREWYFESLLKGLGSLDRYEKVELQDTKKEIINNIEVNQAIFTGIMSEISGKYYYYVFLNPSNSTIACIAFCQGDDTTYDYEDDLNQIIHSIELNKEASVINGNNAINTNEQDTDSSEKDENKKQNETVSKEYIAALKSAESYSKLMNMSKKAIYDQLTSEYGGKFPADAAQYAIDNMTADWNENALKSAESYATLMNMSKAAVYQQLISDYGGKFEPSEAQYAIDNLQVDWNKNALESAKSYQELMNMSNEAIYNQLISQYGGQFEPSEAQYAIDHLDD